MWTHVDGWRRSAAALGVEIAGPFEIALPSGQRLTADLWVKAFGGPRGMVIFTDYDELEDFADEVSSEGFGFSCFEPGNGGEELAVEDLIRLLSDWGWAGDGPAPGWLRDAPPDEDPDDD